MRFERERDQLEVQASTTWESVAARLGTRETLAACPLTVAQCVAVNAAGPDGVPLVSHLESITLVMPEGELRRVNRQSAPKLFALAVGGQGLFGVPYSVTLRVESLLEAARSPQPGAVLQLPNASVRTRDLELLVPPQAAEAFLAEARGRCDEWRVGLCGIAVRRTFPEDETFLRWARHEYAALSLKLEALPTLGGSVRTTQLCRELIDAAIARGGSFAIAGTPEATRAQVEACYPELKALLAEKRRIDPEDKLSNPWHRHHRSLLARESCSVRWNV